MMKNILALLILLPALLMGVDDFVYVTNPKSGTHLLVEILKEVSGLNWRHLLDQHDTISIELEKAKQNNQFLFKHTLSEEETWFLISQKCKFVFLYRDPRDQLISQIFWVMRVDPTDPICAIKDLNRQITSLITGTDKIKPFFENWFAPLYHEVEKVPLGYVCKVKFEDIIGSRGGGSDENQLSTILEIANFLDKPLSFEEAQDIVSHLWGNPGTFRKGIIGDWKNYFTPEHIQLYKERYGNILIELGYETDMNW